MRRVLSRLGVALSLLLVSACALAKPPQDIDAAARLTFEQIRRGEDAALRARGGPELKAADASALASMRAMIPKGELTGSQATSWRTTVGTDGHQAEVQHRYEFATGTLMVETALVRPNGEAPWQVLGIHFTPVAKEDAQANALTLTGKSPAQLAFLAAAIASPLLMLTAIVLVVRAPGLRRKWLWGLLALLGLFSLRMDWTTGEIAYNLLTVQLIGAGVAKAVSPLAPWIVTMTIPVGAVLAILRALKARREDAAIKTAFADS